MNKKILLAGGIATALIAGALILPELSKEEYKPTPVVIVEKSNEQKLTDHLRDTMQGQREARLTRERAENALIEAVSLEEHWNAEVETAIENIKMYQGI